MFSDEIQKEPVFECKTKLSLFNENLLYIEGTKKLILVSANQIKLRLMSKKLLIIDGEKLQIKDIQPNIICVSGVFASLSFEGK